MEKNYTYSQLQVWQSAQHVSKKIFSLLKYFPEEEVDLLAEKLRNKARSLPLQVAEELTQEGQLKRYSPDKSLVILNILEEELIYAYDQGCITERELKTTLEAITIYTHQLKRHQNRLKSDHHLLNHLSKATENLSIRENG